MRARAVGPLSSREAAAVCLLALPLAAGFFALLLWLQGGARHDESLEWRLYVEGWLLVPLLAGLSAAALRARLSTGGADGAARVATLALGNAACLLCAAIALRRGLHFSPALAAIPLLANLPACEALRSSNRGVLPDRLTAGAALVLLAAALLLLGTDPLPSASLVGAVTLGAAALASLPWLRSRIRSPRASRVVDGLLVVALAFVVFDPHLHSLPRHHNWYLGPAHDLLRGAVPLVEVVSSYGILPIYGIAAFFALGPFDLGYLPFSLLCSALVVIEYAVLYALLRMLRLPILHAALAAVAMVVANFLGMRAAVGVFPSLGPLRYGLPLLLPFCALLRHRLPDRAALASAAEAGIVAASSLWSLETFFFTLATWGGMLLVEVADDALERGGWLRRAVRRVAPAGAATLALHAVFAAVVLIQSGQLPQWSLYFDLVGAHAPVGQAIGLGRMPVLGGWIFFMGVLVASTLACAFGVFTRPGRDGVGALACIAGLTFLGVAEFSVYVGKSGDYRLYAGALPVVAVFAFWADRLARHPVLPGVSIAAGATALAALAIGGHQLRTSILDWWGHDSPTGLANAGFVEPTLGCAAFPDCLFDPQPAHPATLPTERLIARFSPDRERLPVFLDDVGTADVLLRAGKRHVHPLNAPFQDGLVASSVARIRSAPIDLREGDVIYLLSNLLLSNHPTSQLMKTLATDVCNRFECRSAGRDGPVLALRLQHRTPEAP